MRLDMYFARRFLMSFGSLFIIFFCIYTLLDMVEQIRVFDGDETSFLDILHLTFLNAPAGIYKILPLIVILGTISLFVGLARRSELVIARAAGRSGLRTLMAPIAMALLIGALAISVFNPIVAATSKQYEIVANKHSNQTGSVLSIGGENLWLRQGDENEQTVIRAERSNLDGTHLFNVTFIIYENSGLPSKRIDAASAELVTGKWKITNAKRWDFSHDNPEVTSDHIEHLSIPSELTRDQIRDSFGTPAAIPIWELPEFITRLERAGFSARQHRVWFQMELALPLTLAAMVMIGAGFTMRHTRFGRTGLMVLLAVLLGFTLFFIRNFAQILGENGQIPIYLAAWAPPVAAILLTLGLLLHLEDG